MHSKVGVWMDHRNAFIPFVDEPIQIVESDLEKHVRYAGRPMRGLRRISEIGNSQQTLIPIMIK